MVARKGPFSLLWASLNSLNKTSMLAVILPGPAHLEILSRLLMSVLILDENLSDGELNNWDAGIRKGNTAKHQYAQLIISP